TGRNSFQDKTVHMNPIDKLYVDIILVFLFGLTLSWFILGIELRMVNWVIYPFTLIVAAVAVGLFLSLVRQMKNKTFFTHTLVFVVFRFLYRLLKDAYDSGSVGMKIVIVLIVYPILTAVSLIFFPIVIAFAVWLALKKVKEFNKIQAGASRMKAGH